MSLYEDLDDLAISIHNVSQGVNAIGVMTLGLMQAHDPYADGFNALYGYLVDADREMQKHLSTCLNAL